MAAGYDILCEILSHTTIDNIGSVSASFTDKVQPKERKHAMDKRLNITTYMNTLTPESIRLLECMQDYSIVLGGSRAAGFFNPSMCTNESDWDFYICEKLEPDRLHRILRSAVVKEFERCLSSSKENIEIVWPCEPVDYQDSLDNIVSVIKFKVVDKRQGMPKTHIVQLIGMTVSHSIESVLQYDLSALQCCLTSSTAISLYPNHTMNNCSVWWKEHLHFDFNSECKSLKHWQNIEPNEHYESSIEHAQKQVNTLESRLNKYKSRGLDIINVTTTDRRFIGDKQCMIVTKDCKVYKGLDTSLELMFTDMGYRRIWECKLMWKHEMHATGSRIHRI